MKSLLLLIVLFTTFSRAQINPGNITIARDSFGIPQIFAPADAEVAYGLAWAHAEDDFNTLQLAILAGKAKLGSALGKKGSINTFGAAQHPDSPHYKDQMTMFQNQQTKHMSLDKKEILQTAERIYHLVISKQVL